MKELELLFKNIKNKDTLPLYFLHGPESFYIDQIVNLIENEYLEEDEKAFNQTVVYGKDTTYAEVLALARQFPMMGEKMVIIVKEAQDLRLAEDEAKLLIAYAENPIDSTVLVFAHKNKRLDGKKRKLATALKNYLFASDPVRDYEVPKIIREQIQKLKMKTTPAIPELLTEYLGTDLSRIYNELAKLQMILKDGEVLDENLVERYIGISKEYNTFELTKALGVKDYAKSFKIVNAMGKNEKLNPIPVIIGSVFSYFSKIVIYHSLADKSPNNVGAALGVSPFFEKEYRMAASKYPLKQATRAITILRDIDMKSKGLGASSSSDYLLKEMVYKLIHLDKTKVKV